VTLVHNHPSGTIEASKDDYNMHSKLKNAFAGTNVEVHDSVIINTDTGKFCVFNDQERVILDKKISAEESVRARIYQFDRKNLYIPTDRLTTIKTSQDVAEFLSKQKRGVAGKFHVMVLDSANHITRYFLVDEKLGNDALKNKLTIEAGKHGERMIFASNGAINQRRIGVLSEHLGRIGIKVLDALVIRQNEDIVNNYIVRANIADHPNTSVEILAELAKDKNEIVREFVADNSKTAPETLAELATDKNADVRKAVAGNFRTPAEVLAHNESQKKVSPSSALAAKRIMQEHERKQVIENKLKL
jgi:F0F1-type ATP synthase epsilon subunit